MKDKDGFTVKCIHCDWRIIDARDNKDFVCMKFGDRLSGYHLCYGDENCKYYQTQGKRGKNDKNTVYKSEDE